MTATDGLKLLNKKFKIYKKIFSFILIAAAFAAAVSCSSQPEPKNIILLIGDGFGPSGVTASVVGMENTPFYRFNTTGLSITRTADSIITDSGAGVTAISTGYRTNRLHLGVNTEQEPVQNIFEIVKTLGYSTGVVSTCSVTDATPSGFVAHLPSRFMFNEVINSYVKSDIDLVIGGGRKLFSEFTDTNGLSINRVDEIKQNGYDYYDSWKELSSTLPTNKFYSFLGDNSIPLAGDRNYTLGDLTDIAIEFLSKNQSGFFLMVEGSQIDDVAHENWSDKYLDEIRDFNHAVNVALDFAEKDGNTLVIVTADHETGGAAITGGNVDRHEIIIDWVSHRHTGSMVNIFSFGPGEKEFTGILENYEIGRKMFQFFKPGIEW